MKALLILIDGTVYEGKSVGATGTTTGEVVFNTSMTGYQEILTDPSYAGQLVALTYPLIGNYGMNSHDGESAGPQVAGFVVKEMCEIPSNYRSESGGDDYLKTNEIVGIEGVDVRALVLKLRDRGLEVVVLPCSASTEEIMAWQPDGIMLSNGPGDPKSLDQEVATIQEISSLDPQMPVFGICLGHQLLGRALGGETFKLKFGHRGSNHPVKDLTTGKVHITSQNHGYAVQADTLPENVEVTHLNLNDNTVEGLRHRERPVFSVQYHPEANPGPKDNAHLFDRFAELVKARKDA